MKQAKKQQAVIEKPKQEITSVENLIGQAIKQGASVETLERILAMRKELKAEWAEEQYNLAMAKFQSNCPTIKKKKAGAKTKAGEIAYYYAPLEMIVEQVKKFIAENGFSYRIETEDTEKGVKVTCIVKHESGHSERSMVAVPLGGGTSVMSAPQVKASAITYAKRYAFCNAFGIMTGDEDNDAQSVPAQDESLVADWQTALEGAADIEELQKVWTQVPPQVKQRLNKIKNQLKKKYENS